MPFVFSQTNYCHKFCVWILRWQCKYSCSRILKTLSQPEASIEGCIFKCSPNNDWNWLSSKCLCAVWLNIWENILQMIESSPKLYPLRIASHIGVSRTQVWPTLHEEDLHPYHDQRVQLFWPRRLGSVYGFVQLNKGSSSAIKSRIHRRSNLYPRWYK
jgi:hypothetical protein